MKKEIIQSFMRDFERYYQNEYRRSKKRLGRDWEPVFWYGEQQTKGMIGAVLSKNNWFLIEPPVKGKARKGRADFVVVPYGRKSRGYFLEVKQKECMHNRPNGKSPLRSFASLIKLHKDKAVPQARSLKDLHGYWKVDYCVALTVGLIYCNNGEKITADTIAEKVKRLPMVFKEEENGNALDAITFHNHFKIHKEPISWVNTKNKKGSSYVLGLVFLWSFLK